MIRELSELQKLKRTSKDRRKRQSSIAERVMTSSQARQRKPPILLENIMQDHCARVIQKALRKSTILNYGFVLL